MAYSDGGVNVRQLEVLEQRSFEDHREGCRTVELGCRKCDRMFMEELEAAKEKVCNGRDFLCLACDPAAGAPAFCAMTVLLEWR